MKFQEEEAMQESCGIVQTHKHRRFLLVGKLEFVPLKFLWSKRVAFVSGKVKYMGAGVFMNPND